MDKRYFIFRVNGADLGVTDSPEKASEVYKEMEKAGFKHDRTDLNNLTTTYYFNFKL